MLLWQGVEPSPLNSGPYHASEYSMANKMEEIRETCQTQITVTMMIINVIYNWESWTLELQVAPCMKARSKADFRLMYKMSELLMGRSRGI